MPKETDDLLAGVASTGFSVDNLRKCLSSVPPEATAPTALCTKHVRAQGTNRCATCGRPLPVLDTPLRERAREFVVSTFTAVDGKAPSDEAVERTTELVCRAFSKEVPPEGNNHHE